MPEGSYFSTIVYSGSDCVQGEETRYDGNILGRCIDVEGSYTKYVCEGNVAKVIACQDNQCQSGCSELSIPLGQCTNQNGISSQYVCTGGVANMVASLAVTALAGAAASFFAFF